ncbi:hypothetical protein DM01DRAFT_1322020 [Hesseltinella vesiculosa]|uniref:Chromatin modification-related protein n=1 Tax=Hesseltinella vesiculosa TaxID=101127 RepID=A0A1X2GIR7_9FUNG|nr:hypothetical protein DM01DRAFT_1322020 [Hesseltinella vesiculosa]
MASREDFTAHLAEYNDIIEELPLELQRNFALIRQQDEFVQDLMEKVADASLSLCQSKSRVSEHDRHKRLIAIGKLMDEALKRGEEKFALSKSMYDTVDRYCTRVDNDLQKFEDEQLVGPSRMARTPSNNSNAPAVVEPEPAGRKRKKRKTNNQPKQDEQSGYLSAEDALQHAQAALSQSDLPIDPNEPVYCYCRQVSYGDMIACDNEECEIEWFHNECVGLTDPPKGKWYCRDCLVVVKNKKKL